MCIIASITLTVFGWLVSVREPSELLYQVQCMMYSYNIDDNEQTTTCLLCTYRGLPTL
jgi:hypothetical protein